MNMKEYAFGIDLGGTTAKVGLFTTAGALLEKWEVPTDTSNAGEHILGNLAKAVKDKMQENGITAEQVEGVGVGVPGPVLDSRIVPIVCANLGGWGERNVSIQLSGLLDGIKVLVGNDADVAALGEIWMGCAKGCRSAVMVTLGTGVGGGVIVNGKIIEGAHGAGGEIGHITVNPHETAVCGCGKHGCLEQYSSATGVVRCMKKLLDENPDTPCTLRGTDFAAKDVFDAARAGDALAAREVDEMTDTLGMALASIASTTDPEMFMVGGGVARAGDVLFNPLREHFKTYAFSSCRETPIVAATLGNDAGILVLCGSSWENKMKLNLQFTRLQDGAKVPVHVVAAGKLDFQQTASMGWQTNWKTMDTAYFPNRVALKTEEQELLGLMSYFCDDRFLAVELVYLESQPESNANLLHQNGQEKKYQGIAKALFAYAVQESINHGYDGVVLFKAKTDTLLEYYLHEFGARPVGRYDPFRLVLWEDAAQRLIAEYEVNADE